MYLSHLPIVSKNHLRLLSVRKRVWLVASFVMLSSCSNNYEIRSLEPLRINKPRVASGSIELVREEGGIAQEQLTSSEGPSAPVGQQSAEPSISTEPPNLSGEKISVNFDGIRLPAFANAAFGDLLKVTFEIDNAVQQREQLVALRMTEPLSPNDFFKLVRQVLGNYGVSVVYQNNIYRLVESATIKDDIPRIIRSRSVPNVPDNMRPIQMFVPLSAIPNSLMMSWLQQSLKDRIQFQTLPFSNSLLILGKPEDVAAARETIAVLDQPALAGFKSMRISPAFWTAERLATQLVEVLTAEGYSVGLGGSIATSIKLVPVRALNIIIVFCTDDTVKNHVLEWAAELDQPGQRVDSKGIFYHQVYNTQAQELAEILGQLQGTISAGKQTAVVGTVNSQSTTTSAGGATTDQKGAAGTNTVIVDKGRNAMIFQGTAEEYAQFRTLAEQMDRAPLEVLIEATIAEVTLKQGESLDSVLNFDNRAAATLSRSTIKSDSGLSLSLIRDLGQFNLNSAFLADTSRVNILSSPRVVASSGKKATIQIGTQVPIITTQQTSPIGTVGGTSALLQDIQYRNTGVILNISPTINSNRRVELEIQQEVSEAQTNNVSSVQSPLILTRSINTSLSINDGETVLLGGLISENVSKSENGIPYLMDIPIVGNIFKTSSKGRNRTELIVLLTPYIIENAETSRTLRDAFRDQLTGLAAESKGAPAIIAAPPN